MSFVMSMLLTTATVAVPSHAPTLPGAPVKPAATAVAPVPGAALQGAELQSATPSSAPAPATASAAAATSHGVASGQPTGQAQASGQSGPNGQVVQQPAAATPAAGVARPAVPAAPPVDPLMAIERQIVQQTNSHRARHGLRPLQVDLRLMQSARRHAAWMASRRLMQHGRAAVAENIAAGQSSPGEAVRDWMNSSGHRANILNSRYSRIGVAAYRGPDGQVYWCQQFLW